MDELQNRIDIMNVELKKYENLLNQRNNDLINLQKQADAGSGLRQKMSGLEDELSNLKDMIAKLDDENTRLKSKLAENEDELSEYYRIKEERERDLRNGNDFDRMKANLEN